MLPSERASSGSVEVTIGADVGIEPEVAAPGRSEELQRAAELLPQLRDALSSMQIDTLHEMVNGTQVELGGQKVPLQTIFLTNKQALAFTPEKIARLMEMLQVSSPPAPVLFIRAAMYTRAQRDKRGMRSEKNTLSDEMFLSDGGSRGDAASEEESRRIEQQTALFVKSVLMPIVIATEALVTPLVAGAALGTPGSVASKLLKLADGGAKGSARTFFTGDYIRTLVGWYWDVWPPKATDLPRPEASTREVWERRDAWYFYNDVCVGADAIIFVDCVLNGDVDFDAHIEFENILMQSFSKRVPSVTVAYAQADDGLGPLIDLVKRKSPLLLLDTRQRGKTDDPTTFQQLMMSGKVSIAEAKFDFEEHLRHMWRNGTPEFHEVSTLAFFELALRNIAIGTATDALEGGKRAAADAASATRQRNSSRAAVARKSKRSRAPKEEKSTSTAGVSKLSSLVEEINSLSIGDAIKTIQAIRRAQRASSFQAGIDTEPTAAARRRSADHESHEESLSASATTGVERLAQGAMGALVALDGIMAVDPLGSLAAQVASNEALANELQSTQHARALQLQSAFHDLLDFLLATDKINWFFDRMVRESNVWQPGDVVRTLREAKDQAMASAVEGAASTSSDEKPLAALCDLALQGFAAESASDPSAPAKAGTGQSFGAELGGPAQASPSGREPSRELEGLMPPRPGSTSARAFATLAELPVKDLNRVAELLGGWGQSPAFWTQVKLAHAVLHKEDSRVVELEFQLSMLRAALAASRAELAGEPAELASQAPSTRRWPLLAPADGVMAYSLQALAELFAEVPHLDARSRSRARVAEILGTTQSEHTRWHQLYDLLHEAASSGGVGGGTELEMSSDSITSSEVVFSGSLYELSEVRRQLQKRLERVDLLPSCNTLSELLVLREAWVEIDKCHAVAGRAKVESKLSYLLLLGLGLASTTLAVLDAKMEDVAELRWSVFGLALATSFTVSFVALINPVQKWQQLRSQSLMLESHVWRFRTRTGEYALQSSFAHERGGCCGADAGRDRTPKLQPHEALRQAVVDMREAVLENGSVRLTRFYRAYGPTTYCHGQFDDASKQTKRSAAWLSRRCLFGWMRSRVALSPEDVTALEAQRLDKHHSPLEPDLYLQLRLDSAVRFYRSRLWAYHGGITVCTVGVLMLAVIAAVFTNVLLTAWVALVSAGAAAITSWSEFSGMAKKLSRYSTSLTALNNLRLWWSSLSPTHQATSEYRGRLVQMTENIIMDELSSWLATSQASKQLARELSAGKAESSPSGDAASGDGDQGSAAE